MTIRLYYFPTPNGRKVSIALEEMGLPYELVVVNIFDGEVLSDNYLRICPNGRIPALTDDLPGGECVELFESGAILQYLGRKTGMFYPQDEARRTQVDAWLMWQMAGLGPMSGQVTWFRRAASTPGRDPAETSLAIHRYIREVKRLYTVLDRQLEGRDFICGEYSIADMASWPWVVQHGDYADLEGYPNVIRWRDAMAARPGVRRGVAVGTEWLAENANKLPVP
ncbi:glutathione S-transferase N-terminal domain-containing protein [Novosphingobium sp. BL-8A]|uniref:glutathione S-transferase family protein n=1 Tax=Novosphingobium sp. BL-8A TaxID=3127639 RepID=UPI003757D606